ncbi:hypothetical protein B0H14DRAFT_3167451 [Mycena olivaceomarginata]|nr:hypothetical protein B0H14DRAFT_3167451 [Mycena olivaceomarginata]
MYRTAPLWSWRNAAVEDVAGGGRSDAYEDFLSGKKDSTHVIVEARMDPFIPSLLLLFPASFHFSIADLKTWSARMCLATQPARRSSRQKPSPPDQEPQLRRSDERRDTPASRPHSHRPLALCRAHSFITNGGPPTRAKENTGPSSFSGERGLGQVWRCGSVRAGTVTEAEFGGSVRGANRNERLGDEVVGGEAEAGENLKKLVVVWFILVASDFVAVVLELDGKWRVYSFAIRGTSSRPTQPTRETKYKKFGVESWKQEESSWGLHLTETRAVNTVTDPCRRENDEFLYGTATAWVHPYTANWASNGVIAVDSFQPLLV